MRSILLFVKNLPRPVRFLLAGGTAAAVEYAGFILVAYIFPQLHISVPQTTSFVMGLFVSYVLNRVWVFKSAGSKKREFTRYAMLAAINLILSNFLIVGLCDILGIAKWAAKFIVMAAVATWNYFIFQKVIFKQPESLR